MLRTSINRLGAGRSVLLDADNELIGGNKTAEVYGEEGGEDVIVVETMGDVLVAVKRLDLSTNDPRRMEMAAADNRVGEANLDWDPEALQRMADQGVDLEPYFYGNELAALVESDHAAMEQLAKEQGEPLDTLEHERIPLAIVLTNAEYKRWLSLKDRTNITSDRAMIVYLLDAYGLDMPPVGEEKR